MKDELVKNIKDEIEVSSSIPDAETQASKKSLYQDDYDAATLKNFLLNQAARGKYSHRVFLITIFWLVAVIAIIVSVGLKMLQLSDAVLVALLGTTTVNVLGFFVIIVQYLFNKEKST